MTNIQAFPISGTVAPGFEPVRAAFEKNFSAHGEKGAAVHLMIEGMAVVDLWGGQAGEVRLLSEASVELATHEQIHARDVVMGMPVRRTLGFMLPESGTGDPRPPSAIGHPGMGGSMGFANPENRLAMGYVMNRMVIGLDRRFDTLCRAVYACLKKGYKPSIPYPFLPPGHLRGEGRR
jgi:hypothetical protein